ncbi:MAG: molybdopterin molybdotransferase MoeA [Pseudomonadota bacterium]
MAVKKNVAKTPKNVDTDQNDDDSLLSLNDALSIINQRIKSVKQIEICDIANSLLRVSADNIFATRAIPPFDNSAVDGYIFDKQELNPHHPTELKIAGQIFPAQKKVPPLKRKRTLSITTGAPLPKGDQCDPNIIVMEENCVVKNKTHILLNPSMSQNRNIRYRGEDIKAGRLIIKKGQHLSPFDLSLIASQGLNAINVYQKPSIRILCTGDEVIRSPLKASEFQIYDTNFVTLKALFQGLNMDLVDGGIIPDNRHKLQEALEQSHEDLIIINAGMSKGLHDYMGQILKQDSLWQNWRLKIKPGRPVGFGQMHLNGKDRFIFGLPGNPAAASVCFLILVIPILQKLSGSSIKPPSSFPLKAMFSHQKKIGRQEFVRAKMISNQTFFNISAPPFLVPAGPSGAGMLSSMANADGLIVLDENSRGFKTGDDVYFIPFQSFFG